MNEAVLPAGIGGLEHDSIVLTHQIRSLDKKRFIKHLGAIEDDSLQSKILEALSFQLGLR